MYQPCSRHSSRRSGIEKQCRITVRPSASRASVAIVSSSASRVWMTSGLPTCAGDLDLGGEGALLVVARRVVAEVVETRSRRSRGSAGRAASSAISSASASAKPVGRVRVAADGGEDGAVEARPAARAPCGRSRASMPMVSMRVTPAARARATMSASSPGVWSRWVWLSITAAWGTAARARRCVPPAPGAEGRRRRSAVALVAERLQQLGRAARAGRVQQHGDGAQALGERAQHDRRGWSACASSFASFQGAVSST